MLIFFLNLTYYLQLAYLLTIHIAIYILFLCISLKRIAQKERKIDEKVSSRYFYTAQMRSFPR